MMFYIILVSKIWYPYKNDPLEHSGTKGTLQGFIIIIFFFLIKGSWMPVMLKPLEK